ncbi:MAG: Trk system potassium transporter TrkH [Planctomycetota bacterium]|nr:MAG: Trk system potassium transporter TrkH [Planctomycetota bacterium]
MNLGAVFYVIGRLCVVLAGLLAVPWAVCFFYGGMGTDVAHALAVSAAVSLGLGLALRLSFEFSPDEFGFGEAFATVTFTWIVFTALGALPFLITGHIDSVVDACFEVLSGFTTTGASIVNDPSRLPEPLLFWRAMTQWIGGMGIVALSVAILPALGAGGNFLFQAEVPGPEAEKLLPRISSTAKLLWGLYLGLTFSEIGLLWWAGMSPFDAVCHAFATVSTGGFGTRPDSVSSFNPAVQWIIIAFMFLSGVNFVMLLQAVRGHVGVALRNTEVRIYTALVVGVAATFAITLLARDGDAGGVEPIVRDSAFASATLFTSTGFATADYGSWPVPLHGLVFLAMFIGACAGSTGGGAKVIRVIVQSKAGFREIKRLLRPKAVFVVKVGGRPLRDELVFQTAGFFIMYLLTTLVLSLLLLFDGHSMITSVSAVVSCLSNIGPGLDAVGPTENYAHFSGFTKLLLMAAMLLGRLEFYSVLVLLVPLAWRR